MRIIIAGGTGLIGRHLISFWSRDSHDISVVSRSRERVEKEYSNKVSALTWDELSPETFQHVDLVINLAGANIGEKRWSKKRKEEILSSRVESTKALVSHLSKLGDRAPLLMNASAIGYYGLQEEPKACDESWLPKGEPNDFLSDVAQQWEAAAQPLIDAKGRVIFLRFGVVLAKDGGALPKMITPFYFGLGGPIGSGEQPFSWVAIDDVVKAIDFLKDLPEASGPYNIVAPEIISQKNLACAIGKCLHRPAFMPLPAIAVKLIFGQMGEELLLSGQSVASKRLQDESHFHFDYPTIDKALTHIL